MKMVNADKLMLKEIAKGVYLITDEDIRNAPTVDAEPVKHGKWEEYDCFCCNSDGEPVIKTGSVFVCSICGREEMQREPYCHCGAKMDLENDNEID